MEYEKFFSRGLVFIRLKVVGNNILSVDSVITFLFIFCISVFSDIPIKGQLCACP